MTDKQKPKKVREIQITQILIVSITTSYFVCALIHLVGLVRLLWTPEYVDLGSVYYYVLEKIDGQVLKFLTARDKSHYFYRCNTHTVTKTKFLFKKSSSQ